VLFTSPVLEHPPAGGPQLRIENSIKALGQVCELHVASRVSRQNVGGPVAEGYYKGLCRSFTFAPSGRWRSANRYVRKAQSVFGTVTGIDIRRDAAFLLDLIERRHIDVAWFGYGNISYPLIKKIRMAAPQLKMVCDTDSVWSRFIRRELPYASRARRRSEIDRRGREKEAEERAWVGLCDVTTAVSEVDAEYYRSLTSTPERIHLFPNVIDLASYDVIPPAPAGFKRPCVFLGGTFGHQNSPMDMAARWVLNDVFPRILAKVPDAHLYIVGTGSERTLADARGPSVTVTGKVPSVLPYLCHADASLVPLKYESGTRFKILEAAACRIPIVSTTLGAEGLPVVDGRDLMLADDAAPFAAAVVEILADRPRAHRVASSCRSLVQHHFSVEHLRDSSLNILNFLERSASRVPAVS
jgi:glycosyltransferase involved in cell wall biosynthesis